MLKNQGMYKREYQGQKKEREQKEWTLATEKKQRKLCPDNKFSPLSDYVILYITTRMIFSFSANKILVQNFWHLKSLVLNSVKSMKLKS